MGIYRTKNGTWTARGSTVNGKREYLGTYKTDDAARNAFEVNEAARRMRNRRSEPTPILWPLTIDEFELDEPKQGFFSRLFKRKRA